MGAIWAVISLLAVWLIYGLIASIFVKGFHILKNISIEPEVLDLINFLNKSGAKIRS